ncbi:MAG: T9SS type A sorting domain-containing protein [Flavobacterium sp.]|nr:T9SS type A sorting domain-containing protein [Flavobacterium sp.]
MKKLYTLLFVAFAFSANAQTNLMLNAGFENWTAGVPDSWFIPASTTVSQDSNVFYEGSSSLSLTSPATGNKTLSQTTDIPVTQGATYVFSGWYLDNDANSRFKYWNQFRTAAGTGGTDTGANPLQAAEYSVDSPEWQFFTAQGTPSATSTVARAGLRIYPEVGTTGGGVIYLDDIKFYDLATMSTSDIENFESKVKMPSVVTNFLIVEMPTRATVNIYSIEGKLSSSNRVDSNEAINVQNLASGTYIVTVQNEYGKTSRKIIKK